MCTTSVMCDESRRRQVRLSRQASAPALTLSHAASSMPGQCGSSSAERCEHVEVTFSGWTCILRQGLEPALTRQSWLRALCFTALPAYFRSRPRTLAIKTRPGGPYRGWGGYEGVDGRPSVFRRGEGVNKPKVPARIRWHRRNSRWMPNASCRLPCAWRI